MHLHCSPLLDAELRRGLGCYGRCPGDHLSLHTYHLFLAISRALVRPSFRPPCIMLPTFRCHSRSGALYHIILARGKLGRFVVVVNLNEARVLQSVVELEARVASTLSRTTSQIEDKQHGANGSMTFTASCVRRRPSGSSPATRPRSRARRGRARCPRRPPGSRVSCEEASDGAGRRSGGAGTHDSANAPKVCGMKRGAL